MKLFLKILILILFITTQPVMAQNQTFKVLVLPDTFAKNEPDAFIYPSASELIGNDVINYLNTVKGFSAPTISYTKRVIFGDDKIKRITKKALFEYKNNYSIDFQALKQINYKFNANWIMLITSNLDVQNYFLRRTVWDFLNIPGAAVVDPAMRLSTQVYVIDSNKQIIIFQKNYQKLLSSRENRMIPTNYAPQTEQMEWIKRHSKMYLAPQIVQELQFIAYKVDEYSNYFNKPEIVKTNPLVVDSAKLNAKRGAVIVGRGTKRYGANAYRATKRYTKTQVNNFKTKQQARKVKSAEKKALKAKKKAEKAQKKLEAENQNLNDMQIQLQQPREVDVILIKEEPQIDYDFTPTKPRLRDAEEMIYTDL